MIKGKWTEKHGYEYKLLQMDVSGKKSVIAYTD